MTDTTVAASPARGTTRTRELVTAALIAALMAATTWISIPIGPVPVTLQLVFVFLAALLLTPGWAAASMLVYLALGAVGLPVFSQGGGGIGMLLGPTGGFLISFPVAASAGSFARRSVERAGGASLGSDVAAVLLVEALVYAIGLPWLMFQAGLPLAKAAAVAMLPFLLPDAVKAILAVAVSRGVRRARGR